MGDQNILKLAADALKKGDRAGAREMLEGLTRREPDNAQAWLLLFSALDNPAEKCDCLKQVVRINPGDKQAKLKLKKYRACAEFRDSKTEAVEHKRHTDEQVREKDRKNERVKSFLSQIVDALRGKR